MAFERFQRSLAPLAIPGSTFERCNGCSGRRKSPSLPNIDVRRVHPLEGAAAAPVARADGRAEKAAARPTPAWLGSLLWRALLRILQALARRTRSPRIS